LQQVQNTFVTDPLTESARDSQEQSSEKLLVDNQMQLTQHVRDKPSELELQFTGGTPI
jgi:hypothetical protein